MINKIAYIYAIKIILCLYVVNTWIWVLHMQVKSSTIELYAPLYMFK